MMKIQFFAVLGFFLVLVSINCATADDVQGESKPNPGLDVKNHGTAEVGNFEKGKPGEADKKLSPVVKETDQVIRDKAGAQNRSDASKQGLKKGDAEQGSVGGKVQGTGIEQKEKKKAVEDHREWSKIDAGISKGSETELKKEKPQGEECYMTNRCTDEGNSLVACLRVPGNDAPGLSLLIQNKGKGIMVVKITVPSFMQVERDSVELKEKENQKIKVSFKKGKEDGDIVLSTGVSRCSLNLKSLLASNNGRKEASTLSKSKYVMFLTDTRSLSFIILALIVLIASVGVWMGLRQRRRLASISNYQKLDMELPVSIGVDKTVKHAAEVNDGWDNGWDDDWDDEEAPMSPLPVTPSLSSKSLPSRKLNKD